ncbi:probable LRR receptor-like serine/threonine-protein kinase At1g74360 [Magnolia sinica]|uniref:probable LRR receptor-like serine/threonine-protein kinase At1g74360 n=1 Tax=Magnolia sinica TaxID=86752 RepID=UPI002659B270|nr:probable LRR receptor-like serine/threonine-protein kinase At1g74360 [Magnolia sinica]
MMAEEETVFNWLSCRIIFIIFLFFFFTGHFVAGISLETDRQVLLQLKSFLEKNNRVNRGRYIEWNESELSPCNWTGISCSNDSSRVIGIDLSGSNISGEFFHNFSALTQLSKLDLSKNTISGTIPPNLGECKNLRYLNLSHNILDSELNLTGLSRLETLDLTLNRLHGHIESNFPGMCNQLITLNLSSNNFSGGIFNCFNECQKLQYLDLSSNKFTGRIWPGFARLQEFSVSENNLTGEISPPFFTTNCSLKILDLSVNQFIGQVPKEVSNCNALVHLNLWGNQFQGKIPPEIGTILGLEALNLGNNDLWREIPESLLNCSKLTFLDLSKMKFGGDIQGILGRFLQVEFLVLHGNLYTGGISLSGILKLPKLIRLDLSFNNFSGELPVDFFKMKSLKFLILANNSFNGSIPPQFGELSGLQALDLSFNRLSGAIPPSIGNMTSLLWLMLANNGLTGEIPPEIGNCSSLLWLNLADNHFSGKIPAQLSRIGSNPYPTFESNQRDDRVVTASGECIIMRRWIPATYPPFSFIYTLLSRKSCKSIWVRLLTGQGLFPICRGNSAVQRLEISGYLQLSGNNFSGEIPKEIGEMQNFSLMQVGFNQFSGRLPTTIGQLPLVVLNVSNNRFSGEIPSELGDIKCLQNLDLSRNNFSGKFPESLGRLTDLNKFNVSYNPFIHGSVPTTGQLSTFDEDSFFGDPNLNVSTVKLGSDSNRTRTWHQKSKKSPGRKAAYFVFLALTIVFLVCGILSLILCLLVRNPSNSAGLLLEESKHPHDMASSSGGSSEMSNAIQVIHLGKMPFTYDDILNATGRFSEKMVVGKGGFGTVYRGVLPDGRKVAVKKLQREGLEGEREFQAEMEVLSCGGGRIGWPHPNLVALFGWCLFGAEKMLVYEYIEGGSLEDFVSDWRRLQWRRRIEVAIDVARALLFLHHECFPAVVHRDIKASNVLLDKEGKARVTDFGLARLVGPGDSHVSTIVAGTIGYVAPEYGQTWRATTKGDVYSFGILAMELATGRRAVDNGEECLLDWVKRVSGEGYEGLRGAVVPVMILRTDIEEGLREMCELLRLGLWCTAEAPQGRPDMKQVLGVLIRIYCEKSNLQCL